MQWKHIKIEQNMVIYKEQNSKEFSIFKANMILDRDFYTLITVLKNIINDKYWKFYLSIHY